MEAGELRMTGQLTQQLQASAVGNRRRQKGNTFVEAAMVLVPLLALIFAIVDYGLAIFVRSTLQHAVREGTRYAVTYRTMPGKGHDASIKTVVQKSAMGFLAGTAGSNRIIIRYYDPVTLNQVQSNLPGNLVEVSVENFSWGWLAPLLRSADPLKMTARSSDRMESLPGGTAPPPR